MFDDSTPAPMLDAPTPGMSLTAPLGDRPWQKPPQLPTAEQALSFYVERLTADEQVPKMLDLLEIGIPVDTLVDTIQLGGVMEGVHSVDVGIIISPALSELISQIATKAGVEHKLEGEEVDPDAASQTEIALQLKKLQEQKENGLDLTEEINENIEQVEEMPEEAPSGLMARRV